MPKTVTKTLYYYDELDGLAQSYARDNYCIHRFPEDWHDDVLEDAKLCGAELGIDIDRIFFSGFSRQGDGVSFDGHYTFREKAAADIRSHAPLDKTLHAIADRLAEIQKLCNGPLGASVNHSVAYPCCSEITVRLGLPDQDVRIDNRDAKIEVRELIEGFVDWVFNQLQEEYIDLSAEDSVAKGIREDGLLFDAKGNLYMD